MSEKAPKARALPGAPGPPTPSDRAAMRRAITLARLAARQGEAPIGAVVYRTATGETLGEGRNTRESGADPCGHAEIHAIRAASAAIGDWRLTDCTLVVTLEPCPMCAGAAVNARVGRLVYGAADPKAGAVHSLFQLCDDARLNHQVAAIGGLMAATSGSLLRAFFRARRDPATRPPKPAKRAAGPR